MTRYLFALLYLSLALPAAAMPTDELLQKINTLVVRVQVELANGGYGVGSGVVVAEDQIVTNCHVIANANSIGVLSNRTSYTVTAIKADWHHDVCILKVDGLNAPVASISPSKNLKYQQPVFATGFPDFSPVPSSTFGYVKALYPMDDSVIVRASSTFRLGDSGGGLFDDTGNLVGVMTLKSPGHNAYYYFMPVEWVQALLKQPEQALGTKSELPFWAESLDKWPSFMRVVQPYLTEDWASLQKVATQWIKEEPNNAEAWFYLAAAEYGNNNNLISEIHLRKAVSLNSQHSLAIYYLGLIAEDDGKHMEALTNIALLNKFDVAVADQLKVAIGISPDPQ
ncbi:MAG: trypsin-like peptidase domain-containing protein [Methylophilaceae bacterium]|nr:trypsin-like peptidase domain-containing protein [Methyloradius sp.]